jgi:hypothetical protein
MANNGLIDRILAIELRDYFTAHPEQYDELRAIINNTTDRGTTPLPSLRGLEFVTTHMARKEKGAGFYVQYTNGERRFVDIYNTYKTALGDYKKRRFDSFRRTDVFEFTIPSREGAPIRTTIGQLQWARWIFEREIMTWAKQNWSSVRKEMATNLKQQRQSKLLRNKQHRKRATMFQQRVRTGTVTITW